jgi:hypothetical protein
MHGPIGASSYTKSVLNVIEQIQSVSSLKDSLFEQAKVYFENATENKKKLSDLQNDVSNLEQSLTDVDKKNKTQLSKTLDAAKQSLKKERSYQQTARHDRFKRVTEICHNLLQLCEAETWQKTQVNSAKILGTLQLLSPGEGNQLAQQNAKLKPAYKAVIALRLLDKLLMDKNINNSYINERYHEKLRYLDPDGELSIFQRDVAVPIIMASIFQDVGLLHPKAQRILKGENSDLSEFRVLEQAERLTLLKINHEQTLDYIINGLGVEPYVGNSREERATFEHNEEQRLKFIRSIIVSALKPKLGIGNILKVPQIYASFILSSKQSYDFFDLPKAHLLIGKAAEKLAISRIAADALLSILGHFPQGYGITYIPKDDDKKHLDRYEYAIVAELNPADPYEPTCRAATRNLTFIANGQMMLIDKNSNLYFPMAKKKLEKINPARLESILRKLVSNFEERKDLDLIPSYWNPYVYFGYKNFQNLWKRN